MSTHETPTTPILPAALQARKVAELIGENIHLEALLFPNPCDLVHAAVWRATPALAPKRCLDGLASTVLLPPHTVGHNDDSALAGEELPAITNRQCSPKKTWACQQKSLISPTQPTLVSGI